MGLRNSISNLYKNLTTKSHSGSVIPLTATRQFFQVLNGFFGLDSADKTMKRFVVDGYGGNPFVYQAISRIGQKTATLERKVKGGAISQQLFEQPNQFQNQIDFDEQLTAELLATGNAFLFLTRGIGAGFSWRVGQSYNVEILINNLGSIIGYNESRNGLVTPWDIEDVLHIKFPNIIDDSSVIGIDHLYGTSPLHSTWDTILASNEIFSAEKSIFKNRGIAGILSNETDVPLIGKNRESVQEELNRQIGGSENYNKIVAMNNKVKYIQTSMSPTDLKTIENNIAKLRIICASFSLNSVPFNDPANTAYNNVKESAMSNMINAYLPTGKKIDDAKSRFLTTNFGPTEIEIDRDIIEVLQREDIKEDPTNTKPKLDNE